MKEAADVRLVGPTETTAQCNSFVQTHDHRYDRYLYNQPMAKVWCNIFSPCSIPYLSASFTWYLMHNRVFGKKKIV